MYISKLILKLHYVNKKEWLDQLEVIGLVQAEPRFVLYIVQFAIFGVGKTFISSQSTWTDWVVPAESRFNPDRLRPSWPKIELVKIYQFKFWQQYHNIPLSILFNN